MSSTEAASRFRGESIEFDHIGMRYVTRTSVIGALRDISTTIEGGTFVSIVGPSGCGKSTLIKMVAGLVAPTSGTIRQGGDAVPPVPNTSVGYIPQHDHLLPWRTAEANVAFPLECRGIQKESRDPMVAEVLALVGLTDFANAYPAQLSGGMRKRVAIARALAYQPSVLLADEPFGALDAQLKTVMWEEFLRIWQETLPTVLFVTHDLVEAITLSDRVIVLSGRPGSIVADRHVKLPRPRDAHGARFDPVVATLHEELWDALKDDVMSGEAM